MTTFGELELWQKFHRHNRLWQKITDWSAVPVGVAKHSNRQPCGNDTMVVPASDTVPQVPPDVALETARQAITDLALDALKGTDRDAARHGLLGELCDEIADTLPDPDRYEAMKAIEVMAANRRGQIARE
jgi:hypothetical protein